MFQKYFEYIHSYHCFGSINIIQECQPNQNLKIAIDQLYHFTSMQMSCSPIGELFGPFT